MSLYEYIMVALGVLGLGGSYHVWLMSYIREYDKKTNNELIATLNSIKDTHSVLTEKLEKTSERVLILDHMAIKEVRVRELLEEYRSDSKQDNMEIKLILRAITENVEMLKTEAAINKALSQREGK